MVVFGMDVTVQLLIAHLCFWIQLEKLSDLCVNFLSTFLFVMTMKTKLVRSSEPKLCKNVLAKDLSRLDLIGKELKDGRS